MADGGSPAQRKTDGLNTEAPRPISRRRRPARRPSRGWEGWLGEPRNAVFLVLAGAIGLGGGRKVLQWWNARKAVARLSEPNVRVADVEAAAQHGRAGLFDLFRILGTAETEPLRHAAGRALAALWAQDQLIAEEEQALVRRGYTVQWHARRRYPRALACPIPITVSYGVGFLEDGSGGVAPTNLEWSHRILGARRASLESASDWRPGLGSAEFFLIPDDFASNGPHRLELAARVRTVGLTDSWEIELPRMPFSIEFDPLLARDALFAMADEARAEIFSRAVRLEAELDSGDPDYLPLGDDFALRNPPQLRVVTPLPCDLAHAVSVEIEGIPGQFPAGSVVLSGQGDREPSTAHAFPLSPIAGLPTGAIGRPGTRRIRAVLSADTDRGWADPEVRSIWPGTVVTEWLEVSIVRR